MSWPGKVLRRLRDRGVASLAGRAAMPVAKRLGTFADAACLKSERLAHRLSSEEKAHLAPNAAFRDVHRGEPAFILGNGPSLKGLDLKSLK